MKILKTNRLRKAIIVLVAGAGLSACSSLQQPPVEFAEPNAMREGPGLFTGERGTIVLKY